MSKLPERIAIICGNGAFPYEIAGLLQSKGVHVHLLGIEGEAQPQITRFPHTMLEWEKIGALFRTLKRDDIQDAVLVGGISQRPDLKLMKLDWGAWRTLPDILRIMLSGDNSALTGAIEIFEKRGVRIRGLAELVPEILVKPGANSKKRPVKRDLERIAHGAEVIGVLGPYDIGQGAVVFGKRVVAVEGVEGTDAMLQRVADLKSQGRLPDVTGGVLVKRLKPGQDMRADLPAIGPQTITNLIDAKLSGVDVEAGKSIIGRREETLMRANEAEIFVYGFSDDEFGGSHRV